MRTLLPLVALLLVVACGSSQPDAVTIRMQRAPAQPATAQSAPPRKPSEAAACSQQWAAL